MTKHELVADHARGEFECSCGWTFLNHRSDFELQKTEIRDHIQRMSERAAAFESKRAAAFEVAAQGVRAK